MNGLTLGQLLPVECLACIPDVHLPCGLYSEADLDEFTEMTRAQQMTSLSENAVFPYA